MRAAVTALFLAIVPWVCTACSPEELVTYRAAIQTLWEPRTFPKHYPEWRPAAQWSKTVGITHNEDFQLFRLGEAASSALKEFAETGQSTLLDYYPQDKGRIFDYFLGPAIATGKGATEVHFFADGNHTMVSMITKIIPSPDWFIGVDSYDLCRNGQWLNKVFLKLSPYDAGTDKGLTFTSPNWPSDPQEEVQQITAHIPAHPASSFYYPTIESLPFIAQATLTKENSYSLNPVMDQADRPYLDYSPNDSDEHSNWWSSKQGGLDDREKNRVKFIAAKTDFGTVSAASDESVEPLSKSSAKKEEKKSSSNFITTGDSMVVMDDILKKYKKEKRRKMKKERELHRRKHHQLMKKIRPPRDCRVTNWSEWSQCSKTCGIGEQTRTRKVTKHAKRGGKPCPVLQETTWCGSARACPRKYFNWSFK